MMTTPQVLDGDASLDVANPIVVSSFDHCRLVVRAAARNFYYGLRLTPEPYRSAIYAIYAWMREADDIADGDIPADAPAHTLDEFAATTAAVLARPSSALALGRHWPAFTRACTAFNIERAILESLLDGLRADLAFKPMRDFSDLCDYCNQVGGMPGLACLRIWGLAPGVDQTHADSLALARGRAFQLTNILRDIAFDAAQPSPRCYIPQTLFAEHQLTLASLLDRQAPARSDALIRNIAAHAEGLYELSESLLHMVHPRGRGALAAMSGIYRELLRRIATNPSRVSTLPRIRVPTWRKLLIAAQSNGISSARRRTLAPVLPRPRSSFSARSTSRHIAIAGGGIAGIACAMALLDAGHRVTLVESRRRLGGRATSFVDVGTGEALDNCQHVTLGCCTNYLDLCRRLGVLDRMEWHADQYWLEATDGVAPKCSIIRATSLPAPGHYAPSFVGASFLSSVDKLAIARAMLELNAMDAALHKRRTFGDILSDLDQPQSAIARFWSPVIVSACNLPVHLVAAPPAIKVFQDGFLANGRAGIMGLATVPLIQLYDHAQKLLASSLRFGVAATVLRHDGIAFADGTSVSADAVVCALPFEKAAPMLGMQLPTNGPLHSPILGIHLTFDQPIMPFPHAVLVDRPTQWLFRKDQIGTRIHAVISASNDWMELSTEAIANRVLADIRACLPAARCATLLRARPVKEHRATFAASPAFEEWRPTPGSRAQGVFLAGDYTATGWPATMEGATRSGYLAAESILTHFGAASLSSTLQTSGERPMLVPDPPIAPGARFLRLLRGS